MDVGGCECTVEDLVRLLNKSTKARDKQCLRYLMTNSLEG